MTTRKLLTNVIIGVSTLGLTSMVFANGGTFAPTPGPMPQTQPQSAFYIGASAGWGDTHWDNLYSASLQAPIGDQLATFDLNSKDTGFAGRVYVGYDYNKYLALEGGWTYLPNSKVTASYNVPGFGSGSGSFKIKNYAFDLMGKVTAPLGDGLAVYAKAGVNYFHSKVGDVVVPAGLPDINTLLPNAKNNEHHWGPVFGVGAQYELYPNLYLNVDWMRFSGKGKLNPRLVVTPSGEPSVTISSYQPNPDVIMGGLTYKFPIDLG